MKKSGKPTVFIVRSAIIAALYAVLTVAVAPLSYGAVQCRVSEALCVLAAFTPAAIPGLTAGCLIANAISFNPVDMLCGTAATFVATVIAYKLRNVRVKGVPILTPLPAVLLNMLVVGLELAVYMPVKGKSFAVGFAIQAASVGAGQFVACYLLGLPIYSLIDRTKLKKLLEDQEHGNYGNR